VNNQTNKYVKFITKEARETSYLKDETICNLQFEVLELRRQLKLEKELYELTISSLENKISDEVSVSTKIIADLDTALKNEQILRANSEIIADKF